MDVDGEKTEEAVPGSRPEAPMKRRPDCAAVVAAAAALVVDDQPTRVGRHDGPNWPLRDADDAFPE